jgi:hypothetical protein
MLGILAILEWGSDRWASALAPCQQQQQQQQQLGNSITTTTNNDDDDDCTGSTMLPDSAPRRHRLRRPRHRRHRRTRPECGTRGR